jgi:hypothetical protein
VKKIIKVFSLLVGGRGPIIFYDRINPPRLFKVKECVKRIINGIINLFAQKK